MTDLTNRFPNIIPMETIRVSSEEHTYEVIEYDDGTTSSKQMYVPDKAPVTEVEGIEAIVDGTSVSLTEGVDYAVRDDDNDGRLESIDFGIGGQNPDPNTTFEITYLARSVFIRYIESYQDELDRVTTDINSVIDSHYVDTATQTGIIDGFEDEQLVEYDIGPGTEQNATAQSAVSYEGDWALELNSPSAGNLVVITSQSGLPRYPQRGDTISYQARHTADDSSRFAFMYRERVDGTIEGYQTEINFATGEFTIGKLGGVKSATTAVDLSVHELAWLNVEITITPLDDVIATLSAERGATLGTVQITDNEYTDGGIQWAAENPNGASEVYIDQAEVIERNSSDLDRVGDLFGELGRRRDRSDAEYITFLKSIVQSFSGRGTVDGIRFAVASALDMPIEKVSVTEDFQENTYEVVIESPFPDHKLSTLTDLADLADPSGIKQSSTRYQIPDDDLLAADDGESDLGYQVLDEEDTSIDEVLLNITLLDPQDTQRVTEQLESDVVAANFSLARWDVNSWDNFDWDERTRGDTTAAADILDTTVEQPTTETVGATVATTQDIDQSVSEPTTVTDTTTAKDADRSVLEQTTVTEALSTDLTDAESDILSAVDLIEDDLTDDVGIDATTTADTATTESTIVAWDIGSFGTMNWM